MKLDQARRLYQEAEDRFNETVDTINRLLREGKLEEAVERAGSHQPDLRQRCIAAKNLGEAEKAARFQINE